MKVLVITPNATGATIIQRFITIFLHLNNYKIYNCHEILNGIHWKNGKICSGFENFSIPRYIKDELILKNQQSLDQITQILNFNNENIVARMHEGNFLYRKESESSKKNFFNFLQNYFDIIITSKRKNTFEQAISHTYKKIEDFGPAYSKDERKKYYTYDYLNEDHFRQSLEGYVRFCDFAKKNFPKSFTIYYEDFIDNPDKILEKIFKFGNNNIFNFLQCNFKELMKYEYHVSRGNIKKDKEMAKKLLQYKNNMNKLHKDGTLPKYHRWPKPQINLDPIKTHSLSDKIDQFKNIKECLKIYLEFYKENLDTDKNMALYDYWSEKKLSIPL